MKRKNYSTQYKLNAMKLSKEKNNVSLVARELGISPGLIHRWNKEHSIYSLNSFPGKGNLKLTDEQREIHRLKKELKEAKLESEILKKAVSIFSKSDKGGMNL